MLVRSNVRVAREILKLLIVEAILASGTLDIRVEIEFILKRAGEEAMAPVALSILECGETLLHPNVAKGIYDSADVLNPSVIQRVLNVHFLPPS